MVICFVTLFSFDSQSNDDLYSMHQAQAIAHLTELEEEVVDMHKNTYEVSEERIFFSFNILKFF